MPFAVAGGDRSRARATAQSVGFAPISGWDATQRWAVERTASYGPTDRNGRTC
ncbi:hypothetical protein BN903_62 [Halorubrum sp. AJ67]|nr:hypothetical protein BN903_62 [Halorubrum sp. AJ67]